MKHGDAAEKLPLLFRTLRGEKTPDDQLDELVEKVKEGWRIE